MQWILDFIYISKCVFFASFFPRIDARKKIGMRLNVELVGSLIPGSKVRFTTYFTRV